MGGAPPRDSAAYRVGSWFVNRFPGLQRAVWGAVYRYLGHRFRSPAWTFMNWGYAALDGEGHVPGLPLSDAEAPDRFEIQLYHRVASPAALAGRTVVEIGCGRGGGAAWMARALGPARVVGLDFSPSNIEFCRARHPAPNLEFAVGDAEALHLPDASVDAVVNVESSHCYGSMARFLAEVRRVVRPGGEFLWADFRPPAELADVPDRLAAAGWTRLALDDITPHVLAALDRMVARRRALIRTEVPRWLQGAFEQFAAFPGSRHYEQLRTGQRTYLAGRWRGVAG